MKPPFAVLTTTATLSFAIVLQFSLATNASFAQQRPDTRTMTCDQARALVREQGAIVLSTGRFTYERLVRNRSFCEPDENTQTAFAPTRDRRKCPVGGKCSTGFFVEDDR